MKRYLPFVIIAAVLAAAVGAGYMLFNSSRPKSSTNLSPTAESASMLAVTVPKGTVLISEFGDYQCPPCGSLHPVLKTLKNEYGDRLQIAFHHYPIVQLHPHALEAAYAAAAAGLQGKFWEMHNLLYDNQSKWSPVGDFRPFILDYARQAGLDMQRFMRDMNGLQVATMITEDGIRAEAAGVNSTPTVFINGQMIPNDKLTVEELRKEINQKLSVNP